MPLALLTFIQVPPMMPIDLTALLAVFMGISIVLIPVVGITARFALKPTVEALSRFFDKKGDEETISIIERRLAFMEQQIESMEANVHRLVEETDFHRELGSPQDSDHRLPPGAPRADP